MLQPLGVSAGAEALYVMLAPQGSIHIEELSSLAAMPSADVMELLSQLRGLGLATEVARDRWQTLPLTNVVKSLKQSRQAELDASVAAAETLHSQLLAASESHSDAVQSIVGRDDIIALRNEYCRNAKSEICNFDRPPYVQNQEADTSSLHEQSPEWQALERGVSLRAVYHPGFDADRLRLLSLFTEKGEQARVGQVPMKLVLIDKRVAFIPSMSSYDEGQEFRASVIRHPLVVEALQWLFEAVWDASVSAVVATLGRERNPRRDVILAMLMAGTTDQAIAAQLDITERSVRRWVAELMEEFGVRTRLQLGAAFARANEKAARGKPKPFG